MVAQTISLPNIRSFFIPDDGYYIADADLSGADAQVVAWEAGDEDLKSAFRSGIKIHVHNCIAMFGNVSAPGGGTIRDLPTDKLKSLKLYDDNKRAAHATNYGASAFSISQSTGWTRAQAEGWQRQWFNAHPGIKEWHKKTEYELQTTRKVTNRFGYHRVYFDRIDGILPEALAWIPQSTVALVTFKGALKLREQLPWVEILNQVHDSLVFQFPKSKLSEIPKIGEVLHSIQVPYEDPLYIPWGLSLSSKSWGEAVTATWSGEILK